MNPLTQPFLVILSYHMYISLKTNIKSSLYHKRTVIYGINNELEKKAEKIVHILCFNREKLSVLIM